MLLAPGVRGVLVLLVDDFVPAWSQQRINILILHNIGKALMQFMFLLGLTDVAIPTYKLARAKIITTSMSKRLRGHLA